MPVDYQQIHARIKEIGAGAAERTRTLQEKRLHARRLLESYSDQLKWLHARVESARAVDPSLRCADPVNDPLEAHVPAPSSAAGVTLIAADGSQITPDRHASVLYSLINIGVFILRPGSGGSPEVRTYSDLKFGDDLYTDRGLIPDDLVALGRDLSERKKLLELATQYPQPVITLTDGPIELWGAEGSSPDEYRRNRDLHLSILSQLQSKDILTAGYIDKPAADLVVRLLEISEIPENQIPNLRKIHGLRGVTDRWLFGDQNAPLLGPGERSGVFAIQSGSRSHYTEGLEIRFFYLNVGTAGHPWIVRVELPAWVAQEKGKVDLLHAALISQCRVMGARPYPYVLHRAHESALVKLDEKQQIEQLLIMELRRNDETVEGESHKQSAKSLPGKKSYAG